MKRKQQQKIASTKVAVPPPTAPARTAATESARTRSRPPAGQLAVLLALLALLAIVPYVNTLADEFALDDILIIVENPLIRDVGNIGKIFTTDYWGEREKYTDVDRGLYRPLTIFTYAINYAFGELKPAGYHLVNVALHTAVTLVLFWLALSLLESLVGAFMAAALFAVHPVHTEAVTGIVGRAELLVALFFMLAFWCARAEDRAGWRPGRGLGAVSWRALAGWGVAALLYFGGLLSKETAITLPALLLMYDVTHKEVLLRASERGKAAPVTYPGLMLLRYAGFAIVLLLYLALRSHAVRASHILWTGFLNVSADERILTASRVLMEYLALLVFPRRLLADYWLPEVPIAHSPAEPLVLLSLLLWLALGLVAVVCWRRAHALFLALAWFFITILPASNLLFASGVGKAERILYLPSAGFCLFFGGLCGLVQKRVSKEWLLLLPLFPILFLFIVRTYSRNADWKDNFTLALATLKVSPTSPTFNQIAAAEYRKQGQLDKVVPLLQEAIRQRPWLYINHFNLGNVYAELRRYDQAVASFQDALRLKPGELDALNGLGWTQMQTGKNAEAVQSFTAMLAIDSKHVGAYQNLGAVYLNLHNPAEAARAFRQGLALAPNHAGLHFNLALTLNQLGQVQEAEQEYQKAVALDASFKNRKYR